MMMEPEIKSVEKGKSFFTFIKEFSKEEQSGNVVSRAFHRLCTLMRKMNVKAAIVERISSRDEIVQEECSALCIYFEKEINFNIFRFTFVSQKIKTLKEIKLLADDKFLASAIIINFQYPDTDNWKTYVYNAIVTRPKMFIQNKKYQIPLLNNYLHIINTFDCVVNAGNNETKKFKITGTFFCQQNSKTSVCAHAALCMTLNNMGGYNITSEDINKVIGIDHIKKNLDQQNWGLTEDDIKKVLKDYGLSYTWIRFFDHPNVEYNEFIYRYIEGRCPALLAFSTDTELLHVVPILGHTLNSDIWRPEAESAYTDRDRLHYKSSSAWVDHFIIHDDNFGLYFCMPVDALKRITLPWYDRPFRSYLAVIITPSNLKTPAWEAEWASVLITRQYLQKMIDIGAPLDDWSIRIVKSESVRRPRPIVVRTLVIGKNEYIKNLNEKDFEGNVFTAADKENLTKNLPDLFWLSEITLPDLYTANKSKVIDFFYECDKTPLVNDVDIYKRWIQIRLPHVLLSNSSSGNLTATEMSIKSHYPLFRFEKIGDTFDW